MISSALNQANQSICFKAIQKWKIPDKTPYAKELVVRFRHAARRVAVQVTWPGHQQKGMARPCRLEIKRPVFPGGPVALVPATGFPGHPCIHHAAGWDEFIVPDGQGSCFSNPKGLPVFAGAVGLNRGWKGFDRTEIHRKAADGQQGNRLDRHGQGRVGQGMG